MKQSQQKESAESKSTLARRENTTVQSISRATSILRCIIEGYNSITYIVKQSGISKGTVHRILKTLEESDLVFQDPIDRKYYLGSLFNSLLVHRSLAHQQFLAQSMEEVYRIWELYGEVTILDAQVNLQETSLLLLESKYSYSYRKDPTRKGVNLYGSAAKVLMSQHSDEEIDIILNSINLSQPSKYGITDKEKIREQFKEARRKGYYISSEVSEGMIGISHVIKGYLFPAALSMVGPKERINPVVRTIVKELKISTERISDNISRNTYIK